MLFYRQNNGVAIVLLLVLMSSFGICWYREGTFTGEGGVEYVQD